MQNKAAAAEQAASSTSQQTIIYIPNRQSPRDLGRTLGSLFGEKVVAIAEADTLLIRAPRSLNGEIVKVLKRIDRAAEQFSVPRTFVACFAPVSQSHVED